VSVGNFLASENNFSLFDKTSRAFCGSSFTFSYSYVIFMSIAITFAAIFSGASSDIYSKASGHLSVFLFSLITTSCLFPSIRLGLFQYGLLHLGQIIGSPSVVERGIQICPHRSHLYPSRVTLPMSYLLLLLCI
jgi:hypothetical protein